MTFAAITTLLVGILFGYLGQRSRMCFVGGIRDYIFVRDTFLLKGTIAFGIVAWLGFSLAEFLAATPGGSFGYVSGSLVLPAVLSGFGVGFLSILANGCPLRQHVLAAQGSMSAMAYLVGFFVGVIVFYKFSLPIILDY